MEINLTEINEKLKRFNALKTVEQSKPEYEGDVFFEIKDLGIDGIFLKLNRYVDSYGEDVVIGFEFVQPKQQTITNYETI